MPPLAVPRAVYRAPVTGLTGPLWPTCDPDRPVLSVDTERTVFKYRPVLLRVAAVMGQSGWRGGW